MMKCAKYAAIGASIGISAIAALFGYVAAGIVIAGLIASIFEIPERFTVLVIFAYFGITAGAICGAIVCVGTRGKSPPPMTAERAEALSRRAT